MAGCKEGRLRELGAFRTLVRRNGRLRPRVFAPVWSDQVRLVGDIANGMVADAETGERFPMKEVLAVTPLSTRPLLGQKLPVADARRRQGLRSFAEQVRRALEETDTRSAPASVAA